MDVSNEDPALSGQSFESIMSRISQLADLLEQKKTLYERAGAITSSGTIYAERLNGAIDVLKNKLRSTISNWYTDDSGSMIFESVTGDSAMMLTGGGWMIADGKTQNGDWNWRTAADGKGIVADRITVGFLSADRIEAGSITTSKLSSEVGGELDLSVNPTVTSVTSTHITLAEDHLDIASGGEMNIESNADINIESGGEINVESAGAINVNSGADINVNSGADINVESGGNIDIRSGGGIDIESGGEINIKSNGEMNVKSDGDLNIEGGGEINIQSNASLVVEGGGDISIQSGGKMDVAAQGRLNVTSGGNVSIAASSNLLPDSEKERESERLLVVPVADYLEPYIGEEIAVSFEIKGTVERDFTVSPYQDSGVSIGETHTFTMPTSDFERFSFTTIVTDYTVQTGMTTGAIAFYDTTDDQDYVVRKIMIELGDTASQWEPSSGVTISKAGILMSSGKLDFKAESSINFESEGTFSVFATDDNSVIKFGGTVDNPNFSLGSGGTIKANKVITENLELIGETSVVTSLPETLAQTIVVSNTQPSGHGIIWIHPGGTTNTVDYGLNQVNDLIGGRIATKTISGIPILGSSLTGLTCSYGVKFRIYNYEGSCYLGRITVTLQNNDGTGNAITVYDNNTPTWVGVGDYISVDTISAPLGNLENLTSASSLKMTVTLEKTASTAARFAGNILIRCTNMSSAGAQLCDIRYIP